MQTQSRVVLRPNTRTHTPCGTIKIYLDSRPASFASASYFGGLDIDEGPPGPDRGFREEEAEDEVEDEVEVEVDEEDDEEDEEEVALPPPETAPLRRCEEEEEEAAAEEAASSSCSSLTAVMSCDEGEG